MGISAVKIVVLCCMLSPVLAVAQPVAAPRTGALTAEERTARRFEEVRRDPVALRAFLRAMPKGGDLHSHLSGAVYGESYIRWAAEDSLCVDPSGPTILSEREPCDAMKGHRPAKDAHRDPALYNALIDILSVRNH